MYLLCNFLFVITTYKAGFYELNYFYKEPRYEWTYAFHIVSRIEYGSRSRVRIRVYLITFGKEIAMSLYFISTYETVVSDLIQFSLFTVQRTEIILKSIFFGVLQNILSNISIMKIVIFLNETFEINVYIILHPFINRYLP